MSDVSKHFVTFYSPGTLFAETTTKPVDSWDVDAALKLMQDVTERYNAKPYGFRFTTRSRGDNDLDSREIDRSPMYFVGGKVETLAEIRSRNDPADRILLANMEGNGYDRVWTATEGWSWTQPLDVDDIVLEKVE